MRSRLPWSSVHVTCVSKSKSWRFSNFLFLELSRSTPCRRHRSFFWKWEIKFVFGWNCHRYHWWSRFPTKMIISIVNVDIPGALDISLNSVSHVFNQVHKNQLKLRLCGVFESFKFLTIRNSFCYFSEKKLRLTDPKIIHGKTKFLTQLWSIY